MKSKLKIFIFVCLYFFIVPAFYHIVVRADSYTFLGTENGDWYNANNWQEGIIPTSSDQAVIQASVSMVSLGTPTIDSISVYGYSEISIAINANNANFYENSSLNSEINGNANFYGTSFASYNANVTGTTNFYNSSFTLISGSNAINATFYDTSENRGILGGDGEFRDQSKNTSTGNVNGTGTFACRAINEGIVATIEYSPCTLYYFTNTAEESWDNLNLWFLDSDHTIQALRLPGELDTVYINAHVSNASGSISINTLYVTSGGLINLLNITAQTSYFYNDAIQAGSLYGTHITFSGSSVNTGILNAFSSADPVQFIDSSQNQNHVIGSAFFACGAINTGTVTETITNSTCVTNVTSSTANGSYRINDIISVNVTFDHSVTVTGNPQLSLSLGGSANPAQYSSGSGTDTLTFLYTVELGMYTSDLDYADINALALNGGTIHRTSDDTEVTLTLPTPGSPGSLSANKNIIIDSQLPIISDVTGNPATSTATITWTTNEITNSRVYYGTTSGNYVGSISSSSNITSHTITLSGLSDLTTYYFIVVSGDLLNNFSTSTESQFITTDGTRPSVTLTAPVSGTVSGTFNVTADATDNDEISNVKFYIDDDQIGSEDTTFPYSRPLTSTSKTNGNYVLYAVAEDEAGNFATSTSVSITIRNDSEGEVSQVSGSVAKKTINQDNDSVQRSLLLEQINTLSKILKEKIIKKDIETFTRNLSLHDVGEDVRQLQMFLNREGFTVSQNNYGSAGQETNYFGIKTYKALVNFQSFFGLPSTGFLGTLTRNFVNNLLE